MSRVDDLKEAVQYRVRAERAEAKFEDLRKRALIAEQRERAAKQQRDYWRARAERTGGLDEFVFRYFNERNPDAVAMAITAYENQGSDHEVE
jgi:hypothetical protein